MRKRYFIFMSLFLFCWLLSLPALAAGPNFFSPAIYADGEAWATKGLGDLPPPNGHNDQSFDKLFMFVNGAEGQLAVAEAAPGNPLYNGGRWSAQLVMWLIPNPPVLTSYDDILFHETQGNLVFTPAHDYFECPLLPLKN